MRVKIRKGDTKSYEITVKRDGSVEDITGWTFYFTAKAKMEDADSAAEIDIKVTDHDDPTAGESTLTLSSDDTNITPGTYHYALDYKTDDDEVGSLAVGKLTVEQTVRQTKD